MNIEELRTFCLSLPGTEEKMPFEGFFHNNESLLTFNVGGHIFWMADINSKQVECTIKVAPDKIEELKAQYHVGGKPYNFSLKCWVSISADKYMPEAEIYKLIKVSYDMIKINN